MIRDGAALLLATKLKPEAEGLELLLTASLIQAHVRRDEKEQALLAEQSRRNGVDLISRRPASSLSNDTSLTPSPLDTVTPVATPSTKE